MLRKPKTRKKACTFSSFCLDIGSSNNDPKHTSRLAKEWLQQSILSVLDHPPLKNLWDYLDRQIRKRNITSKETLEGALLEEWAKIPTEN